MNMHLSKAIHSIEDLKTLALNQSNSKPFLFSPLSAHKMEPGREEDICEEAKANNEDDQAHEVPVVLPWADFKEAEDELFM